MKKFTGIMISTGTAIILFILYFLFHFHFMQRMLDYDQVIYGNNIVRAVEYDLRPVINPHHLHFETAGVWFHKLVYKQFGVYGFGDPFFNNRLRSLLFASLGVVLAFFYLKNLTGSILWGIIGAVLTGSAHGYLFYSTKVDTAIYPTVAVVMILLLMQILDHSSRPLLFAWPAGLLLFVGLLFHQYVLLAVALFLLIYLLPSFRWRQRDTLELECGDSFAPGVRFVRRFAVVFVMGGIAGILAIVVYFYAGKTVYNLPVDKPAPHLARHAYRNYTFQQWLFLYEASGNQWGNGIAGFDPLHPVHGFTEAFLSRREDLPRYHLRTKMPYNFSDMKSPSAFVHNITALFYIMSVAGSLLFFPFMLSRYGRNFLLLGGLLIVYSLFFTYWEPLYLEFWLIPVMMVSFLGLLVVNMFTERLASVTAGLAGAGGIAAVTFITLLILFHNTVYYLHPYSRKTRLESIPADLRQGGLQHLMSPGVYRYPDDPYSAIDRVEPEEIAQHRP